MKKILLILFLTSFGLEAQIHMYKQVFSDSTQYKDFNQGLIDAKQYFKGTGDFIIGSLSLPVYYVPAAICYATTPKDRRFTNPQNPNNEYLFSNVNYYRGYKYGATKKKRKRLIQGAVTPLAIGLITITAALSIMSH
ncbi:MAG: hypothetical protein P8I82_06015 [Flavobacteriales bacterium]|nr:hypothetical protein [Flavobacteriales bacterium]